MLSASQRLTDSRDFTATVRHGRRAGGRLIVVHHRGQQAGGDGTTRAGVIVSKAVGGAVVRTRTKRRLRHLIREHWTTIPPGMVVVRAQARAAAASYAELSAELGRCLERVSDKSSTPAAGG